ncbi:MAG: glycosyltransferase family 9 protein [Bacillota bacterium]
MKILVINLASIGDCIMRTPLTRALKIIYPGASIDMLVTPVAVEIASMDSNVDNVISYDKRNTQKGFKGIISIAHKLRKEKYDLSVCTNYALRGAFISWLAGIKKRCGYDEQQAKWFLTNVVSRHILMQYEAKNQLRVLQSLAEQEFDCHTELHVSEASRKELDEIIGKKITNVKTIVFCPLSNFENRSLSIEKSKNIVKELSCFGKIYIVGSLQQSEILKHINCEGMAVVLAGVLTLKQLAALIERADVMLSVDTGPMHMAVALNTPTIGLFGANLPGLWGAENAITINHYADVSCSPCWGAVHNCDRKCFEELNYDKIIADVKYLIKFNNRGEDAKTCSSDINL